MFTLPFFNKKNMDDERQTSDNVINLVQPNIKRQKNPHYTIGINDFNETVLLLHGEYSNQMSLTMNHSATLQLIKMLEATLPEEESDAQSG